MYEKYELPIRFTEEQRKKYAEWGIKKGKVLMPMAAVTIGIDLLTVLWNRGNFQYDCDYPDLFDFKTDRSHSG